MFQLQVTRNEGKLDEERQLTQVHHTEELQERKLGERFPSFNVIYRDVFLWGDGLPLAEYDTLLVRPEPAAADLVRISVPDRWRCDAGGDAVEFPTPLDRIPGKLIYGEASDNTKHVRDFLTKFERLDFRPFELLLLVHGVAIECTAFEPSTIRCQIEWMQGLDMCDGKEKALPPNLSMVTLLVGGRVEIRRSDPSSTRASYSTMTSRLDKKRKVMEALLDDAQQAAAAEKARADDAQQAAAAEKARADDAQQAADDAQQAAAAEKARADAAQQAAAAEKARADDEKARADDAQQAVAELQRQLDELRKQKQ
jgi:hypothetical protein